MAPGDAHLTAPQRRRVPVAVRRWRLRDHVIAALLEDDVQVAVVLGPDEHHRGDDGVDVMLEGSRVSGRWDGAGRVTRK